MWTSFHHQPETQHPKSSAIHKPLADYPILPRILRTFGTAVISSARRNPRSSASGKLKHSILDRMRRMGAARAPAAAIGHEGDRYPRRVEKQAGQKHELTRHGADRRPRKELIDRADRGWMDQQLADIGSHLNEENPAIVVPQPPADCLEEGDVETGRNVILVKRRVPTVIDSHTLPAQNRSKEIQFQYMRPDPKKIEEAVSPSLDYEKIGRASCRERMYIMRATM